MMLRLPQIEGKQDNQEKTTQLETQTEEFIKDQRGRLLREKSVGEFSWLE